MTNPGQDPQYYGFSENVEVLDSGYQVTIDKDGLALKEKLEQNIAISSITPSDSIKVVPGTKKKLIPGVHYWGINYNETVSAWDSEILSDPTDESFDNLEKYHSTNANGVYDFLSENPIFE